MGKCKGDAEEVAGYTDQEPTRKRGCSEEGALKARRLVGHLVQQPG